jgi:F-type H+-transporting ATPase subunit alpha
MKQVSGRIKLELAQYREMEAFAQFGSDLDVSTQRLLNRGARLTELLRQDQYSPMAVEEQVVSIFAGVRGCLDGIEVGQVQRFEMEYMNELKANHPEVIEAVRTEQELSEETEAKLVAMLDDFVAKFA